MGKGVDPNAILLRAPRRGSDRQCCQQEQPAGNFNPRSPWGERPADFGIALVTDTISIHAPRGGSDAVAEVATVAIPVFQSTLPVGGATNGTT